MRGSTALLGGDPTRIVHVGDRENDIYEFYCATQELGTHFVVRTFVDRLAGDGKHTVLAEMAEVAVEGHHQFEIADGSRVKLALKYKRIDVLPPIGKARRYPPLNLTVIHAIEVDPFRRAQPGRLEAAHRSSCRNRQRGDPENGLVRDEMEDRAILQDPQVRLQC